VPAFLQLAAVESNDSPGGKPQDIHVLLRHPRRCAADFSARNFHRCGRQAHSVEQPRVAQQRPVALTPHRADDFLHALFDLPRPVAAAPHNTRHQCFELRLTGPDDSDLHALTIISGFWLDFDLEFLL
jgi:hypothetical protein